MGRPFTVIFLFFVLGIILSRFWTVNIPIGIFLILYGLLLLAMEFNKKASSLWMALLLVLFGFFIYQNQFPTTSTLATYGKILPPIEVKILNNPQVRNSRIEVEGEILTLYRAGEKKINEKTRLIIMGNTSLDLKAGEIIRIEESRLNKEFNSRKLEGYDLYLRGRGIRYQLMTDSQHIVKLPQSKRATPLTISYQVKGYVENFYDETLQNPQREIMKSVLLGNQGYLSPEIRTAFSRSGTAHIVAVSGLHIGIIVLMLEQILKLLTMGRNKRLIVISGGIMLYGYIVGFPVSIIRAGAMYLLYVLAYFLDRRYDSINCLMLIGFITLVFNPLYLFSVAFQLSFSATLSILTFYPLLKKIPLKIPLGIKGLLGVTLGAQLGTIPIIAYHFNEISIISLAVNLLIVPTLGILLSLGFISILAGLISHQMGALINYFTNGLLTYIYVIVESSSKLPYSSLQVEGIKASAILVYYIILCSIYYLFASGKYLQYRESWRKNELSKDSKQY